MIANRSKALLPVPSGVLKIPALLELTPPTEPVYFSLIILPSVVSRVSDPMSGYFLVH